MRHLQWILGADGDDLILVVAQLTGPGASLADPLDEAGLMGAADGAAAPARAQQLPLWEERPQLATKVHGFPIVSSVLHKIPSCAERGKSDLLLL